MGGSLGGKDPTASFSIAHLPGAQDRAERALPGRHRIAAGRGLSDVVIPLTLNGIKLSGDVLSERSLA